MWKSVVVWKRHVRSLSKDVTKPFQDCHHLPWTECNKLFVLQAQKSNVISNWFSYKVMLESAVSLKLIIDNVSIVGIITCWGELLHYNERLFLTFEVKDEGWVLTRNILVLRLELWFVTRASGSIMIKNYMRIGLQPTPETSFSKVYIRKLTIFKLTVE